MSLLTSLLTAIVRADGDALVLHAGERPYVVAPSGHSELASRALTLDAMNGMLGELLPAEARTALDEYGAVQHDLPYEPFPAERFTVIAARGGEDVWIEIRRQRKRIETESTLYGEPVLPPEVARAPEPEPQLETQPEPVPAPAVEDAAHGSEPQPELEPKREPEPEPPPAHIEEPQPEIDGYGETEMHEITVRLESLDETPSLDGPPATPSEAVERDASAPPPEVPEAPAEAPSTGRGANVVPLSRDHLPSEQTVRFSPPPHTGIDRLLRIAAARGASTVYLTSQARPSIRVDGKISPIEGEAVLTEPDVEALMLDIIPEPNRETLWSQAGTEWTCDIPEVGRIRCVTFRDHRGAGGIIRMIPARAISAEQLGLSREIQGLCAEAEGLVLVTGPRSSGKSTLVSAFVDLINRTRSDHVITLESEIKFVHENRLSFVSQREVRGDRHELLAVARAALRENPDVLVIEDFDAPGIAVLALEAAQSGHLVIGALTSHTATEAVDRIIGQSPPERRPEVQLELAENLRGIVAQVLLRKIGGGRVAAREVLLNTSAVANLIAEGKTSQLPMAIDNGRKHGMVALNDALVAFVQNGIVDSREAYRRAADRQGFLTLLKRTGVDTASVERLA